MLFRLLILLGVVGGLAVFAQSNWSSVLSITFLGLQTPALPLSLWVLGAIAVGVLTQWAISLLLQLASYATARKIRREARKQAFRGEAPPKTGVFTNPTQQAQATSSPNAATWKDWSRSETTPAQPSQPTPPPVDPIDDWEAPPSDDWENRRTTSSREAPSPTTQTTPQPSRPANIFETPQAPRASAQSGTVYSHKYRESNRDEVHKREPEPNKPIVDAEYRVIVPPYQTPSQTSNPAPSQRPEAEVDADDWFEDDTDTSPKQ
ncbi:MAG TPA: hypothetical protein IGS53_28635 [Leptolyngbyaceae cyanobacterium M33_DOE_097]|uniref:DUF1049 domain-containing protein n=1 Tax=Oscillatoriales cyanobacterium SpSt-418 TaxID=2282169 RepID=A0A7C3KHU5_9CYAN|nr:hypothetical protein [Leptolyngbyaceae cyanobacterium M33_DOE_097]